MSASAGEAVGVTAAEARVASTGSSLSELRPAAAALSVAACSLACCSTRRRASACSCCANTSSGQSVSTSRSGPTSSAGSSSRRSRRTSSARWKTRREWTLLGFGGAGFWRMRCSTRRSIRSARAGGGLGLRSSTRSAWSCL